MAGRTHPNKIGRDLIYPLERRAVKIALGPFDDKQTERQIAVIGAQELRGMGGELQRFTNGLPGLNDAAVRRLVQEKSRRPDANLRHYLVVNLVFEKRLARVGADSKLQRQLLAVAPLRQFDANLLRVLANERKQFDSEDRPSNIGDIRSLLQKFQKTRLVEPHPDGYGYVMPRQIRPMLDDYFQQTELDNHFEVHRIAADYFKKQVDNKDSVAIANRLYHLAGLQHDLDIATPEVRPQLLERLDSNLRAGPIDLHRMSGELRQALDNLYKGNQADRAFDLGEKIKRVLEQLEFKEMMGPEIVEQLIFLVSRYSWKSF